MKYDILDFGSEMWELMTFLQCDRLKHDLRLELQKTCKNIGNESFAPWGTRYPDDPIKQAPIDNLKARYELAFTALLVVESHTNSPPINWNDDEFTILYRCVNYGRLLSPGTEEPGGRKKKFKYVFSFSEAHAKRLSEPTLFKIFSKTSRFAAQVSNGR